MLKSILKSLIKFALFVTVFTSVLYSIVGYNTKAIGKCTEDDYKNQPLRSIPSGEKVMSSENNITQDNAEWEVVRERRKGKVGDYEVTILKRNDGFTFTDIGLNREWQETFLAKGNFGEFKFLASRVQFRRPQEYLTGEVYIDLGNYGKYSILDKYIIWADWFGDVNKKLLLIHAKDIESALLRYPLQPFYKDVPVKEILFNIGTATRPHYIHADDIKLLD